MLGVDPHGSRGKVFIQGRAGPLHARGSGTVEQGHQNHRPRIPDRTRDLACRRRESDARADRGQRNRVAQSRRGSGFVASRSLTVDLRYLSCRGLPVRPARTHDRCARATAAADHSGLSGRDDEAVSREKNSRASAVARSSTRTMGMRSTVARRWATWTSFPASARAHQPGRAWTFGRAVSSKFPLTTRTLPTRLVSSARGIRRAGVCDLGDC